MWYHYATKTPHWKTILTDGQLTAGASSDAFSSDPFLFKIKCSTGVGAKL